jgi:hypothetical protein
MNKGIYLEKDQSLDILGIKPIGNAVEKTTSKTLDGASAFLSRICLPAAEEFGFLLQDKVKNWRTNNTNKILEKAEAKLSESRDNEQLKAHPLITWRILENGSWSEHNELHEMWAGLLASSCDETGEDDSNLMFIDIISKLSEAQVKILNYSCENSNVILRKTGLVSTDTLKVDLDKLEEITGITDLSRLDRELDYLRSLSLISELSGGFSQTVLTADISPTDMALHLYVRCQGYLGDLKSYFDLKDI